MDEKEQIRERLPIEQVVGRQVPLKRAGRILKGLCPFHNEKSPSFTVNPERGIYKCFGCGEGGDIFDFVMKTEGLTFPEALKLLADQAGVELPEYKRAEGETHGPSKERLYALNTYCAKLWHTILMKHPKAEDARTYVKGRGLHDNTLRDFLIGFAPPGTATAAGLKAQGFTMEEIAAAGEPTRFAGRITFPITDITGRTIGFTGRQLVEDPNRPKYWNTPETALFQKSRAVYGLQRAKDTIRQEDLALLVEGQMDVVTLHQFGFTQAVASSGTALTAQQLSLIARFSRNIAFAYDADKAGQEATRKGIELTLEAELNPSVVTIPGGKDPAEALNTNADVWHQAFEHRKPFMAWLLDRELDGEKELTPQRKKEVAAVLEPWLKRIKNPIEQQDWLRLTASRLQTDSANLIHSLPVTAIRGTSQATANISVMSSPDQQRAELALSLLLSVPEAYPHVNQRINDLLLSGTTVFLTQFFSTVNLDAENLADALIPVNPEQRKTLYMEAEERLHRANIQSLELPAVVQEVLVILQRLGIDAREQQKTIIAAAIQSAQAAGDRTKVQELLQQLKELI